jgi:hypothetical protein
MTIPLQLPRFIIFFRKWFTPPQPKIGTFFLIYMETPIMSKRKKEDKQEDQDAPYTFSDEATQKKIKKHLTDIKDVITEEDIANVKVPGEEDTPPPATEDTPDENKDEEKGKLAGENKPITPWDVID